MVGREVEDPRLVGRVIGEDELVPVVAAMDPLDGRLPYPRRILTVERSCYGRRGRRHACSSRRAYRRMASGHGWPWSWAPTLRLWGRWRQARASHRGVLSRLSAPPSTVFENFLFDIHTRDNLPAKQNYRSRRILDFARMEEQQRNRNHPSIRRSFEKERFSKHALIVSHNPEAAETGCKHLQTIPIVLICRVRNMGERNGWSVIFVFHGQSNLKRSRWICFRQSALPALCHDARQLFERSVRQLVLIQVENIPQVCVVDHVLHLRDVTRQSLPPFTKVFRFVSLLQNDAAIHLDKRRPEEV